MRRDRGFAPGLLAPMAPWLAAVAFAMLLARAASGLVIPGRTLKPKQLGYRELAYSITATLLLAAGYRLGF